MESSPAIYQEFNLVPHMSVVENLFLGREPGRLGFPARATERRRAREILGRLDVDMDLEARAGELTVAQQQIVEAARALLDDARVLIMDEPTAALTPREVDRLFVILAGLRERGHGVLFISHRLDEVLSLADRVTVMRDGETLGTWQAQEMSRERLIELMVDRPLDEEFPKEPAAIGAPLLELRSLCGGPIRDLSFQVRRGEVLGLAGLVGSGRTETARLIFGADRMESGAVLLDGRPLRIRSPRDAVRHGICLLTEDRKRQGLAPGLSARDNFALPNLGRWSRFGWIRRRRESEAFARYVTTLKMRVSGPEQPAGQLSGGNQQKLLVARWLENDAQVILFDEPTRGIDVGAKVEMDQLINDLARRGKAVRMISSELPEILGMSDRILVMRSGRITGEIADPSAASQEQVMEMAAL